MKNTNFNTIYCTNDKDPVLPSDWRTDYEAVKIIGNDDCSVVTQELIILISKYMNHLSEIELDGVTEIADNTFANLSYSSFGMIIPETVTKIGYRSFAGNSAFNALIIPSTVKTIGNECFNGCNSLNNLFFMVRNGVLSEIEYIPEYFISGGGISTVGVCFGLASEAQSFVYAKQWYDRVFGTDYLKKYDISTITIAGDDYVVTPVGKFCTFPDSVTQIQAHAFDGCSSFCSTLYTNQVSTICDYAFNGVNNLNTINLGTALIVGSSGNAQESEKETVDVDTDTTITAPYTITLVSKRQFRYEHFDMSELVTEADTPNVILPLNEEFKYCLKENHFMIFKNGYLIPKNSVYIHSVPQTPLQTVSILLDVSVSPTDTIDVFYVTNSLRSMNAELIADKYDTGNNKLSIIGTDVDGDGKRTGYIRMDKTYGMDKLFGLSSRNSTLIFLNGEKIRYDDLNDISDTIIGITTNKDNAINLEVFSHLDTQDIIEQLYIRDGLNHSSDTTKAIADITGLPNASIESELDQILNSLTDEQLDKIFYANDVAPTIPYDADNIRNRDFATRDTLLNIILNKFKQTGHSTDWINIID